MDLRPEWTGEAIKLMHIYHIKQKDLCRRLFYSQTYVSKVLSGTIESAGSKDIFINEINKIIAERKENQDT